MRETTLVIFGSPEAGTPVMAASPLQPRWAPATTSAPTWLSLAGINALTDALVAS